MTVNSEPVDTLDTSATVLEAATEHETEQIVMQQVEGQVINGLEGMVEGQVIMMTNVAGAAQHVVITCDKAKCCQVCGEAVASLMQSCDR